MPRQDRSDYYIAYYTSQNDLRKVQYYEKKIKQKKEDDRYAKYGGEKAYYKMKYREFCSLH